MDGSITTATEKVFKRGGDTITPESFQVAQVVSAFASRIELFGLCAEFKLTNNGAQRRPRSSAALVLRRHIASLQVLVARAKKIYASPDPAVDFGGIRESPLQ